MKTKINIISRDELTLEEAFKHFINFKTAMNLSKQSIKYYEVCYRYFEEFYGGSTVCNEITEQTTYDYLNYLKNNKSANDISIQTYMRGLRVILYFFMQQEYIQTFKMKMPKAEEPEKDGYTDSEVERLVKKPNLKKCTFSDLRNWAMVCYFLGTGNRLSTATNLK